MGAEPIAILKLLILTFSLVKALDLSNTKKYSVWRLLSHKNG